MSSMQTPVDFPRRPARLPGQERRVEVKRPRAAALTEDEYRTIEDRLSERAGDGKKVTLPRLRPRHRPPTVWITVDGVPHWAASQWLRRRHATGKSEATISADAKHLAVLIGYLLNVCGLDTNNNELESDVWVAATAEPSPDDHIVALRTWLMNDKTKPVQPATWNAYDGTFSAFFVWLEEKFGVRPPLDLHPVHTPYGQHWSSGLKVPTNDGSTGQPLSPEFVTELLWGAMRITPDGVGSVKNDNRATDYVEHRDHAFITWGVATGMRIAALRSTMVGEVHDPDPKTRHAGVTEINVPSSVTKGMRGGAAWAFSHHVDAVLDYIEGPRRDFIDQLKKDGTMQLPENPIVITQENQQGWATESDGVKTFTRWNDTPQKVRERLVYEDADGAMSSASLFLTRHGAPISKRTALRIVPDAAKHACWLREQRNKPALFPSDLTCHDLRHTFACHLAFVLFQHTSQARAQITGFTQQDHINALHLVQHSLGHVNIDTTVSTYLHAYSAFVLSGVTVDQILGRD